MRCIASLSAVVAAAGFCIDGHAQTYPVKPIRMINAYAPGGASDVVAHSPPSSPRRWASR